ncbi:hypothetical protein HY085_01390 [Candidatus Gottesmanbacteria bacterium]|nr:hypothetical protein [Candidatus Gottesmanbacteria bacterium]
MGYFGKLEEKQTVQRLRRLGWSYGKIKIKVPVSKDSISRWCRNIRLSQKQKLKLLNNKKFGQKKGSMVAAENRHRERIERIKTIRLLAKKELGRLSKRDKFIAGIAFYAAEGDKADKAGGFANSDPAIIKFMKDWFLDFLKVPMEKLHGAIWIHDNLDAEKAKQFWSNLTGIPFDHFQKTYIAKNKKHSKKIRKNIHQYGVFSLEFYDLEKQRKVIGWTLALTKSRILSAL